MLSTQVPALMILLLSLISLWVLFPNFVLWLLTAEVCWIGLFLLFAMTGATLDSLNLAIWGLFLLCLATSESALGLSLLIFNLSRAGNVHNFLDRRHQPTTANTLH